ncbi:MAG: hypothetical protein QF619_13730 [Candidatus Binatia bacterium]|jgi:hypothetical protein|nr:hypothetical protein [Candidatus Binatia bacterium]
MPYNDPDPTDPNVLVGVVLPGGSEAKREMAYVFAEEFARMGYNGSRLLGLFKNPFYAAAYDAYCALGEEAVRSIVEECVGAWGQVQFSILDLGREPQSDDLGLSMDGGGKIQKGDKEIES